MFAPHSARRRAAGRPGANIAMAVALMCGTALGVTAMEAPAHAQKKKEKETKPDYSKAFVAAYQPVDEMLKAEAPDLNTVKAALPGVLAATETPDDKYATGGLYYNVGRLSNDETLQIDGVKQMLASGKTSPENIVKFNTLAGQLSYNAQDYAGARTYLERAIDAGAAEKDLAGLMAETYFNEGRTQEGLTFLRGAIRNIDAAGGQVDEAWVKRGLSAAYEANNAEEAIQYSLLYVDLFPSESAWGDAIAIQRNMLQYELQETLDLLRLARRASVLRNERDYLDYVDAADFRRLPGEVNDVIAEGIADGSLSESNPYVVEVRTNARKRLVADESELPKLAADARKAGANSTLLMAAGDAYLNYDRAAEAEEFYTMALGKPGVDTARVLTRLGIAQLDQGKTAEAQSTFAQVEGARRAIARLWDAYAKRDMAAAPVAATMEQPSS